MNNLVIQNQQSTMSSTQLAEMLGFDTKSSINKAIRKVFDDSRLESYSEKDARGYVIEYHLPELESKMFVAKHDIQYLEEITQYWINKDKQQLPDFNNPAVAARAWLMKLRQSWPRRKNLNLQPLKLRLLIASLSQLAINHLDRLQSY